MQTDPITSTKYDGAPCIECGEDAVVAVLVQGRFHEVPLCGACADGKITECPGCDQTIWSKDGTRLFRSSSLFCPSCVSLHENRDTVNEVRR